MNPAGPAAGADVTGATTNTDTQAQPARESLAAILEPDELKALNLEETNDEQVEGEEQNNNDGGSADGDRASKDVRTGETAGDDDEGSDETEGKVAGEEDDEKDEADPKKPDPFDDARVQKRLSREARKRDRLMKAAGLTDEQIAEVHGADDPVAAGEALLSKRAAAQPVQIAPTAAAPLAHVNDAETLGKLATEYRELKSFAMRNPGGYAEIVYKDDAGKVTQRQYVTEKQIERGLPEGAELSRRFDADAVAEMLAESSEALESWIPARQQYLAEEQKTDKWVRAFTLPTMFEEGSEQNAKYQNILRQFPEVTRVPQYKELIAHVILGQEVAKLMLENARKEQAASGNGKNGNGSAKVKPEVAAFLRTHPAKAPGVPGVRGTSDTAGKTVKPQDVEKARQRVEQGGGEEAEIDFISASRASQQKAKGAALV